MPSICERVDDDGLVCTEQFQTTGGISEVAPEWVHQLHTNIVTDLKEHMQALEARFFDLFESKGLIRNSELPTPRPKGWDFQSSEPSKATFVFTSPGASRRTKVYETQPHSITQAMNRERTVLKEKNRRAWQNHTHEYLKDLIQYHQDDWRRVFMRTFGFSDTYMLPPDTRLAHFVNHRCFQCLTIALVTAHIAWITYSTEIRIREIIRNVDYKEPHWYEIVSYVFSSLFGIELIVRIAGLRWSFFFAEDWRWNLFDAVIAVSASFDIIEGINLRVARAVRALRIARVLRVVKLFKFISPLKQIVIAMFMSLGTLMSAVVVILLISLLFSLFFLQSATFYISELRSIPDGFVENFGGLEDCMISLYSSVGGGVDWYEFSQPIRDLGWFSKYMFISYVSLMTLGVLNILIGILCNVALGAATLDRDIAVQNQQAKMTAFLVMFKEIYEEIEQVKGEGITLDQFQIAMKDEALKTFLFSRGLNVLNGRQLFELIDELDGNENEHMDLESFIMGMMMLTGDPSSTDIALVLHEQRHTHKLLSDYIDYWAQLGSIPDFDANIASQHVTRVV